MRLSWYVVDKFINLLKWIHCCINNKFHFHLQLPHSANFNLHIIIFGKISKFFHLFIIIIIIIVIIILIKLNYMHLDSCLKKEMNSFFFRHVCLHVMIVNFSSWYCSALKEKCILVCLSLIWFWFPLATNFGSSPWHHFVQSMIYNDQTECHRDLVFAGYWSDFLCELHFWGHFRSWEVIRWQICCFWSNKGK